MRWRNIMVVVAFAAALAGCTRYPPEIYGFEPEREYVLNFGDEVRVVVYEVDNLPQVYKVDASGHISMPLAGLVPARGKTVAELERNVSVRLRAKYVKEPKVAAMVVAYRPFYVLGEVRHAGAFPFVNGLTVESAVAIAGGYTERAYLAEARVVRQVGGASVVSYVPGGYPVRPGDTIYVPERWY